MDGSRAKRGYLVVNTKRHPVFEGLNTIGRNKQSVVTLLDHTISHQQAVIVIINEKHYICDTNSCNGTQLDHIKLCPLQLYEIGDKGKIYFGNVKAIYEMGVSDSNSQERSQASQINDSVFDMPTQSLYGMDVTTTIKNTVDSRAIGDHARFETCVQVHTEPVATQVVDPPINKNNVRDIEAALLVETSRDSNKDGGKEEVVEAAKAGEVSSLSIHELPTQLIEGNFELSPHSCTTKDLVFSLPNSAKYEKVRETNIGNENIIQSKEKQVSIYDMPTQICTEADDSKQINEDLQNLPERTWDADFFTENTIHDEPTQLVIHPGNKSSITSSESQSTNDLSRRDSALQKDKNQSNANIESTDEGEEATNDSRIIEETIVNDTIENKEEEDLNVDEDSNCSADFLTMEPATQFFDDNPPGTTVQVFIFQSVRADNSDDERLPNERAENNDSESTTSNNLDGSSTTTKAESKKSDDNIACSLKTNLLKRRVKNIIFSDNESREKGDESSDETDIETNGVSEDTFPSSLKAHLLTNRVRNVITSDNEEESLQEKRGIEESSDETDIELPAKNNDILDKKKKKMRKRASPMKSNQHADSDSDTDNAQCTSKKDDVSVRSLQRDHEKDGKYDSSDTDVEKNTVINNRINKNTTLNDSDLIPATQDSPADPISSRNPQKKSVLEKLDTGPESLNSEESVDYSLDLILTESFPSDETHSSRNIGTKVDVRTGKESKKRDIELEHQEEDKSLPKKAEIAALDDDIFSIATQPLTSSKLCATSNQKIALLDTPSDGMKDDVFLKPTATKVDVETEKESGMRNIECEHQEEEKSLPKKAEMAALDDDIFSIATQPLISSKLCSTSNQKIALLDTPSDGIKDDVFLKPTAMKVDVETDKESEMRNIEREHQEEEKSSPKKAEMTALDDDIFSIATQPLTSSKVCSNSNQKMALLDTPSDITEDDIFLKPTAKQVDAETDKESKKTDIEHEHQEEEKSSSKKAEMIALDDDIFFIATQPLTSSKVCSNSNQKIALSDAPSDGIEDDIFLKPTQEICKMDNVKNISSKEKKGETKIVTERSGTESLKKNDVHNENLGEQETQVNNPKCNFTKMIKCDDDIFMQPTQPIVITKKSLLNTNQENTITRNKIVGIDTTLIDTNKEKNKEQSTSNSTEDESDIFLQSTQPVVILPKDNTSEKKSKGDERRDDEDIFLQPTQDLSLQKIDNQQTPSSPTDLTCRKTKLEICKFPVIQVRGDLFTNATRNLDNVEATMQKLFQSQEMSNDLFLKSTQRLQPSVESQLEMLFASQTSHNVRNDLRPQNPLANILENLQSQNEKTLPQDGEEANTVRDENNSNQCQKSKCDDQGKTKKGNKSKNQAQNKQIEQEKVSKDEKPDEIKDQEKKDERTRHSRVKEDQKEKSKSHNKKEKVKHKDSKKKEQDSCDTSNEKNRRQERKSKNEDELVQILQSSKIEKEKTRREVQKIRNETESQREVQCIKEKVIINTNSRPNSPDKNELMKKPDSRSSRSDRSLETIKSSVDSNDKATNNINLQLLGDEIESEKLNRKKNRAGSSDKQFNTASHDNEVPKSKQTKRTRASSNSSVEEKRTEMVEGDMFKRRTRAHSSSPIECPTPKSEASDNKRKQLKAESNKKKSTLDASTAKPPSERVSTKIEAHCSKEIDTQSKKKKYVEKEDESIEETNQSKKSMKRSPRTQKSSQSPTPQLLSGLIGDNTAKSSSSTLSISDESNSPFGDNIDSSFSLRRSKRKLTNERVSHKLRLKKHKREPELSLIEEVPEYSERADASRPSIEIIDLCQSDSNKDLGKVPERCSINEIENVASTSTPSSKVENDNTLTPLKRHRQKHRRHSGNSEDDFVAKTMRKRSKLDVTLSENVQSSNGSDKTLSSSSFLSTPERSRRKIKPKVVFTMMDSPELESVIRRLGGSVVDTVDASTVLMTTTVKRSQKLLAAVGQGKPICSPAWLEESKKANKFLDPWDYILQDREAENKWNFSLGESLNRSQSKKLFENYFIFLLVNTAADVLKGAIEACGGKCAQRCPAKYQNIENFVIVSHEENRSKYAKFLKHIPKPIIVTSEAIFDAVLRQEMHFEDHLLM